jgi:peptidoglycan hydrolase CwlO-like protein
METLIKYKKVIAAAGLSLILFIGLALIITQSQSCLTQHEIEKVKANVNTALKEAENINANIEVLKDKQIEAQANVNAAQKELEQVQNEVDEANKKSDEAVNNVGVIVNRNYNGTSTDSANSARCRAFPDSPECKR